MKNILVLTIITLILASCGGRKESEFLIKGTVKGADTGMVFLQKMDAGNWANIDSAKVTNGEFSFKGGLTGPEFRKLFIKGMPYVYSFFIENADIKIVVHADSTQKLEVAGSPTQDIFSKYQAKDDSIDELMKPLDMEYDLAQKAGDTLKMKKLDSSAGVIQDCKKKVLVDFIRSNGKSIVSPYLTIRFTYLFELPELENLAGTMDTSLRTNTYYQAVQKRVEILRKVQIGQTAPDFTMNDTTGKPLTLSSLKGRVLLVDFWASWCGPCRAENPNVVKAYQAFHKKGFDVLGVSLDKANGKEKWMKAINHDQLTWNHVSDLKFWGNEAAKLYGINSIPSNVLLDKDQVIIGRNLRGADLMKKLTEIYGAPLAVKKTQKK